MSTQKEIFFLPSVISGQAEFAPKLSGGGKIFGNCCLDGNWELKKFPKLIFWGVARALRGPDLFGGN